MKEITLTINGTSVTVEEGTTILEAAKKANIDIPTLCYLKEINEIGDCRMCIVEVEGKRRLRNLMHPKSRRRHGCTYRYREGSRST